jgi:hypothetical protein
VSVILGVKKRELARLLGKENRGRYTIGCHRTAPDSFYGCQGARNFFFLSSPSVYTEFIHWSVLCTYG